MNAFLPPGFIVKCVFYSVGEETSETEHVASAPIQTVETIPGEFVQTGSSGGLECHDYEEQYGVHARGRGLQNTGNNTPWSRPYVFQDGGRGGNLFMACHQNDKGVR